MKCKAQRNNEHIANLDISERHNKTSFSMPVVLFILEALNNCAINDFRVSIVFDYKIDRNM